MNTASLVILLGLMLGLSGCSVHSQLQKPPYTHYQDDALAIQEAREAFIPKTQP